MRTARETNWGHWRMAERRDFLAGRRIRRMDIRREKGFDPTVSPALMGKPIRPARKPIRRGYVYYYIPSSASPGQPHKVQLTIGIGKNSGSPLRFWIPC